MKSKLILLFISINIFNCVNAQTWQELTSGTTYHLQGVSAPSATICYAVGYNGTILKTSNGGTSWLSQTTGTTQHLASVQFTDINTGYAVGDNGAALKTTDGGNTWNQMTLTTGDELRNVKFINADTGYISGGASGNYGSIFKTTNAGATWSNLNISAPNMIYSTYFTSDIVGYASEYSGLIFKTTDGGINWNSVSSGVSNTPTMVVFTNPTEGILISFTGAIKRTTNAGASWTGVSSGTSNVLQGIDFYDGNNGIAVGGNSNANTATMISTNDGGVTWSPVVLNNGINRLCRIDFVDQNTAYVVGLDGTILKYSKCNNINTSIKNDSRKNTKEQILTYPNPFTDNTLIDFKNNNFTGITIFSIFNVAGKKVFETQLHSPDKFILERGSLPAGLYYFNISDSKGNLGSGKTIIN